MPDEAPDSAAAKAELSQLRMATISMAAVGLASLLADPELVDVEVEQMRNAAMQMVNSLGPQKVHAFIQRSLLQAAQSMS